ncbi:MAG: hypothetical protein OXG61_10675 [Chloroflexi bacterium]|nr:hypothetical protein [Chloroflexota bacterium]
MRELRPSADREATREQVERLESELAALRKREERLVQLFGYEEVDSAVVRQEFRDVQRRRDLLAGERAALAGTQSAVCDGIDEDALRQACARIADRLEGAGREDQQLLLEAVQLRVEATREEVTVEGILPLEPPEPAQSCGEFKTIERTLV